MRVLLGLVVGLLIGGVAFYLKAEIITYGIPFYTGFVLAIIIVLILLLFGYALFFDFKKSVGTSEQNTNQLLAEIFPNFSEEQVAWLRSKVEKGLKIRFLLVNIQVVISLFLVIGGVLGSIILLKQNTIIEGQSTLFENQNALLSHQNESFDFQNKLVKDQSDLLKIQNKLAQDQNELINNEGELLALQNSLYNRELEQAEEGLMQLQYQNILLAKQDSLLSDQIALSRDLGNVGAEWGHNSSYRVDYRISTELDALIEYLKDNSSFQKDNERNELDEHCYEIIINFTKKCRPTFFYNSPISDYKKNVSLEKSRLLKFLLSQKYEYEIYDAIFKNADFSYCLLISEDLSESYLKGIDLGGSCLEKSNLANTNLSNSILSYCSFVSAYLNNVELTNSDVRYSLFYSPKYNCEDIVYRQEKGVDYILLKTLKEKYSDKCIATFVGTDCLESVNIEGANFMKTQISNELADCIFNDMETISRTGFGQGRTARFGKNRIDSLLYGVKYIIDE